MDRDGRKWREQLADRLVRSGQVRDDRIVNAFRVVPRHVFLPGVETAKAYEDVAIPTKWADGQPISSSSQPAVMAAMLQQLGVEPGQRVLEIGAGTGYNAALLAHLVGESGVVTTLDIDEDLVAGARRQLGAAGFNRVSVVRADGADGWPAAAPYDRIILTVGASDLSPAWVRQLALDGRLVLPLSLPGAQLSVAFERVGEHELGSVSIIGCGFMHLRGKLSGPDVVRSLAGDTGLLLKLDGRPHVDAEALSRALTRPGEAIGTGVVAGPSDVMGGLGLWVALHEHDAAQLHALGDAAERRLPAAPLSYPGWALTLALVGARGLAALVRQAPAPDPVLGCALGVRPFGLDADGLAERLAARVRDWHDHGRPHIANLRIVAQPLSAVRRTSALTVDRDQYRMLLEFGAGSEQ